MQVGDQLTVKPGAFDLDGASAFVATDQGNGLFVISVDGEFLCFMTAEQVAAKFDEVP